MKIAFVASQGGHLGQIKILFTAEAIENDEVILITEHPFKEKKVAEQSFLNRFKTYFFEKDYLLFPNPLRYLKAIKELSKILKKEQVDLVVSTGAQIAIPAFIAAKLHGIKTFFIDTVIRVKTPNWSARFSYYFSDYFLVQHPQMISRYGRRAKYLGGII